MSKRYNFNFTSYVELEIEVDVIDYLPSRPAPACSNPSSPAFSDCGDDAEWNDIKFYYIVEFEKYNKETQKHDNLRKRVQIMDEGLCAYLEESLLEEIIEKGECGSDVEEEEDYERGDV